jgi:hypothetical protein
VPTSGNPPVKPRHLPKLRLLPDFPGKCRIGRLPGFVLASRSTTALRDPANYGLRGWISTRSSDLAQVLFGVYF